MWPAGISSYTLNGRSWGTERWWLTSKKPQCMLMGEQGSAPRSSAPKPDRVSVQGNVSLSEDDCFLLETHQLKKCNQLQAGIHPSGAYSMNPSISPSNPTPETQFQAWKMQVLARLGVGGGGSKSGPHLLFPSRSLELEPWKSHTLQGGGRPMTAASRLFQRTLTW